MEKWARALFLWDGLAPIQVLPLWWSRAAPLFEANARCDHNSINMLSHWPIRLIKQSTPWLAGLYLGGPVRLFIFVQDMGSRGSWPGWWNSHQFYCWNLHSQQNSRVILKCETFSFCFATCHLECFQSRTICEQWQSHLVKEKSWSMLTLGADITP